MEFSLQEFSHWFKEHEDAIAHDYFRFLRFRSISTDPSCKAECRRTAEFLVDYLTQMGMQAELLENEGHPVVFAKTQGTSSLPSVLLYHHYDVQPVDPLELWDHDPFEPVMREGKVFARGASDNKGQCFLTLTALKAIKELLGEFPLEIKVFIEGEEESGGKGTELVLIRDKELLRADFLCVIDFDLAAPQVPAIALGYRGIVALQVDLTNAKTDLHSGVHGGIALNPNRLLVQALSALWDEKGKVAVPGFYEGILPLSEQEKACLDLSFDERAYKESFGVGALAREEGVGIKEAGCLRPTVEINGLIGGYTGEGFKTVIPAKAQAKLSCRLVPGQDPEAIAKKIEGFLQERIPEGAKLSVSWHHGARALRSSSASFLVKAVKDSMEEVFENPCRYTLCGGSVPIVDVLTTCTEGEFALFGFALDTDQIHAPNEHFRWESFRLGFLSMVNILNRLSKRGDVVC